MNHITFSTLFILFFSAGKSQDSFDFRGQLSAYSHYNAGNEFPWWNGIRYIPQAIIKFPLGENGNIDFELSANLYGNSGIRIFSYATVDGKLKPYRIWVRYYTQQFELRAGLQKINFGSATILRPLMWFDQVDPRDPLQLTDGVWGVLGRYYFLNNANVWLWALYGNNNPKGWERVITCRRIPELGGRVQLPVATGEAAISYHYRVADSRNLQETEYQFKKIPEHRIGFDARFDWVVGCWAEASWKKMKKNVGAYTHQEILNLGLDYTFGLGNGLTVIYEQLLAAFDEKAFHFNKNTTFSLLSASYPLGIFDKLNFIVYFDWNNETSYNFINWQKQFNRLTVHFIGYINPKDYYIPTQQATDILFAGNGIQIMLVYNY